MAVPYGKRFTAEFDELIPQGEYVIGKVTAVTESGSAPPLSGPRRHGAR